MKVSLNWIKSITEQYHSSANLVPDGINALVEKIGAQLGAVEEVIDIGKKYEAIVVVKVVSCQKHPNGDKLSVCLVDDGKSVKSVKRNKDGLVEIVCGAANVKVGMLAAWIPPGATVPSTYDKEPFVIEAREIRGVISNGMLASLKELDIGDDHSGILEIDKTAKPGDSFAELYRMDDFVIDIENKMFTHRPDCFGMLGIARELAGIQGLMFRSPDWYREAVEIKSDGRNNGLELTIKNDVPKLVPRFCAVVIKDIKVGPSPVWLRASLSRVGVKSINNIVDLTNFYMLLTAQPLHAYDYNKVKTRVLGARLSKKGEKLKLLGGKEITLADGAVVITDGKKPVGLGGIMGGADTEVDDNTKNIILECANFDMNITRKTAMEYGLFTDAATRFTKNQSPRQNRAVIAKTADDILKIAGGRIGGQIIDDKHFQNREKSVKTNADFINGRLGLELAASEIKKLLENVEFKVVLQGLSLQIEAPFWRTDIEIPEDIVEEVGRLYGYDKLPKALPERDLTPASTNQMADFKNRVRNVLSRAGANEVLTYSFVHGSLLKKVSQDPKQAYQIANALSPDLQHYRLSLTPSLLEKVHPNIRAGYGKFALFEIGKTHVKNELDAEKLPKEYERLSLVIASKDRLSGAPYFAAKALCDYLLHELGIHRARYVPLSKNPSLASPTYYQTGRSAEVKVGSILVGRVGEYQEQTRLSLKLPESCAGFDLHLKDLLKLSNASTYRPLNRFPELEQDLCLRTLSQLSYGELTDFVLKNLERLSKPHGYKQWIKPIDIYQREGDEKHKQTTWRIVLWHPERTLTTQESNVLLDKLAENAKKELKAERI